MESNENLPNNTKDPTIPSNENVSNSTEDLLTQSNKNVSNNIEDSPTQSNKNVYNNIEDSPTQINKNVSNNSKDHTSDKEEEAVVFKVPIIGKKLLAKKEKQSDPDLKQVSEKGANFSETSDLASDKIEKRPLISFQPKSLTLPSQVYKPHRPSASEYIEHYYKMEKEGKQPKLLGSESKTVLDNKSEKNDSKMDDHVKVKSSAKQTKLSYNKPGWSTSCENEKERAYSMEVLKSGAIIDRINLSSKEYFVFGRLSDCDVTLEHPSISRLNKNYNNFKLVYCNFWLCYPYLHVLYFTT